MLSDAHFYWREDCLIRLQQKLFQSFEVRHCSFRANDVMCSFSGQKCVAVETCSWHSFGLVVGFPVKRGSILGPCLHATVAPWAQVTETVSFHLFRKSKHTLLNWDWATCLKKNGCRWTLITNQNAMDATLTFFLYWFHRNSHSQELSAWNFGFLQLWVT